jgi:hypothetical protein
MTCTFARRGARRESAAGKYGGGISVAGEARVASGAKGPFAWFKDMREG